MKFSMLFLGLLSFALTSQAQDHSALPALEIRDVIDRAMEFHPNAQMAKQSVEMAEQNKNLARAELKPSANASYNMAASHNPMFVGEGQAHIGTAGATAIQPLIDMPALQSYKAAKIRLKAATSNAVADTLRVAGMAAASYIEVLKGRITLDFAAENYYFIDGLITSMKSGDLSKRATESDITIANGSLGTARNDKHIWMAEEEASENNFYRDSGVRAHEYYFELPEALPLPETSEAAVQLALAHNPELHASQLQVEAGKKDIQSAKSEYLPRVQAFANGYQINRGSEDMGNFSRGGLSAGISVSVPLYDAKRGPQIVKHQISNKMASLQVQNQSLSLEADIRNIYAQRKERKVRLQSLCESLENRLKSIADMTHQLFSKYTVQELLIMKHETVRTAIMLNNEFLAEVYDSYSAHIQMGTLIETLHQQPRRQPTDRTGNGSACYDTLLKKCGERRLL